MAALVCPGALVLFSTTNPKVTSAIGEMEKKELLLMQGSEGQIATRVCCSKKCIFIALRHTKTQAHTHRLALTVMRMTRGCESRPQPVVVSIKSRMTSNESGQIRE